jgi:hypothetical protein
MITRVSINKDKVSGEIYLVDSEVVKDDLEDVASKPQDQSQNNDN